jgi:hypothetical protein
MLIEVKGGSTATLEFARLIIALIEARRANASNSLKSPPSSPILCERDEKIARIRRENSYRVPFFSTASHSHASRKPNDLGNESIWGGGKWADPVGQRD